MEPLPIDPYLPELVSSLRERRALVLVAEPGAGKTTRLPRALLDAAIGEGEIVVLEPRRLAARLAARRVAAELGEQVGERVGYQVRFEELSGPRTRLRFITEGILARRIASDPSLVGVSAILLDEFHERHLQADLLLALARALQRGRRPDLLIAVLSATLDAEPVARFLGCEPWRLAGRSHPVAIEQLERPDDRPLHLQVATALRRLLLQERVSKDGDVLVFLPGAHEIRRALQAARPIAAEAKVDLVLLHGDLPAAEQDRAVAPGDRPRVILATNVAETSITLPRVVAVVDSGLARVARHSSWSGLPSLETRKVSQASAAQRAGRAGRTQPGRCLRLYTRHDHDGRPPHELPEVRRADLAEAVLVLRAGGVEDPAAFGWLEAPPAAALAAADRLLVRLGALDEAARPTPLGRHLLALPLHPRLGRLVVEAAARGALEGGALVAALIAEREIRRSSSVSFDSARSASHDESGASDLLARLGDLRQAQRDRLDDERLAERGLDAGAVRAVVRAADQIRRSLGRQGTGRPTDRPTERRTDRATSGHRSGNPSRGVDEETALLVATLAAFPDRVARRRAPGSLEVLLSGGGSARLADFCVVRDAPILVAVDAEERKDGGTLIRSASAIEVDWLLDLASQALAEREDLHFDPSRQRVMVASRIVYDELILDERVRPAEGHPEASRVLAEAALAAGPTRFCDSEALARWRSRVDFVAGLTGELSASGEADLRDALVALCEGRTSFAELRDASLLEALRARLSATQRALVERLAPEQVTLPGGRRLRIVYEPAAPPSVASRLQDFFGLRDGPRIAEGRVALVLRLLAPNQRAVQVTTDLAGFWQRHYPALRRELMRRYPRHAWPEDPTRAPGRSPA